MQTPNDSSEIKVNRRTAKASTTLSRKYTKRPQMGNSVKVNIKKSPEVKHFAVEEPVEPTQKSKSTIVKPALMAESLKAHVATSTPTVKHSAKEEVAAPVVKHPIQEKANAKLSAVRTNSAKSVSSISGKEMKEQAIQKALTSAKTIKPEKAKKSRRTKAQKINFGMGRVMLAFGCAAAAVAAIVYFVNLNMPDISMQVAAMQNGINPAYPGYVPKDYNISGIVSAEGKITMNFKNSTIGKEFSLIEEKSSWDTDALLNNFVKTEYGDDYTIVREQGLTIYISGSSAAWVNGGNVYKIVAGNDTLTNKQIRSIAVSL